MVHDAHLGLDAHLLHAEDLLRVRAVDGGTDGQHVAGLGGLERERERERERGGVSLCLELGEMDVNVSSLLLLLLYST